MYNQIYKDVPLLWAPSHRKMKRFSLTQRLTANSRDVLSALTGQIGSVGSPVSLSELNAANLLVVNMKRRLLGRDHFDQRVNPDLIHKLNTYMSSPRMASQCPSWVSRWVGVDWTTHRETNPGCDIVVLSKLLPSLIQLNTALQGLLSSWAATPNIWLGTTGKEWRVCQHTNSGMPGLRMTSTYKVFQTYKSKGRHHRVSALKNTYELWQQRQQITNPLVYEEGVICNTTRLFWKCAETVKVQPGTNNSACSLLLLVLQQRLELRILSASLDLLNIRLWGKYSTFLRL